MILNTTSQAFFEHKYRLSADPWMFATSKYELGRYRAIMRMINGRRFKHAYEPGCSIGVLTRQLAQCCDRVDAVDISSIAVEQAQLRCRDCANVYIECGSILHPTEGSTFDLIIFSEIGYYFEEPTLRTMLVQLVDRLEIAGTMVACHWQGQSPDHILSGSRVHEIINESNELIHRRTERHVEFLLGCWSRK